jgi:putative DNA primase/helicase
MQDLSGEIIKRLAQLSPLQYERDRNKAALKFKIRTTALDKLVGAQRKKNSTNETLQGRRLEFPEIEPWPEPVNGAEVFSGVADAFSRYISLPNGAADVLALWCAHAHFVRGVPMLSTPKHLISGETMRQDHIARPDRFACATTNAN